MNNPGYVIRIGVTGSAGSGKSLVCRRFGQLGAKTLDCDQIARQVVEPGQDGLKGLVNAFGPGILDREGFLDRKNLRNRLVQNKKNKAVIERILHPLIRKRMCRQMDTAVRSGRYRAVVVEVPLLFESDMARLFDVTLAVTADESILVERIRQRDGVSGIDAKKMLDLQISQQEKERLSDHVIKNNSGFSQLFESVDKLFDKIEKEFLTS